MKLSKELKVGLIAIVSLVLLYWGFNFLKGAQLFDNSRQFYAVYDRIDGLSASKKVTVNGYSVGRVAEIKFHPDGSGRLIVRMEIDNDLKFSKTTIARITGDILGDKSVALDLGLSPEEAQSGDTLLSEIELSLADEVNKQVAPIKAKAEKLIGSIDTVLILVSGFLNEETKENFYETFNSLRRSFQTLENTVKTVDQTVSHSQGDLEITISSLSSIARNLEANNDELTAIFANFENISDSLARVNFKQTFTALNEALVSTEQVMSKINNGEGTAGMLVNDPSVYLKLQEASEQLELLLEDVRYNPNRYINFSLIGKGKTYTREEIDEMEAERKSKAAGNVNPE